MRSWRQAELLEENNVSKGGRGSEWVNGCSKSKKEGGRERVVQRRKVKVKKNKNKGALPCFSLRSKIL